MMLENIGKSLKNLREESIVYVAAELFLQEGIEAVKMTDIAARAEVGVASLYRYFGTKEALVIRAGALLWQDLNTLFSSVYEAEDFHARSGMEQITRLFGVYRRLFQEQPGFIRAPWCGDIACEEKIKADLAVTSRCIPFEQEKLSDTCVMCGKPATKMVYWGRAY